MEKEDLNGFLEENAIKIFLFLNVLFIFVSFCLLDNNDLLGLRSSRFNPSKVKDVETMIQMNVIEVIFVGLVNCCILVEFIISYVNNSIEKRILLLKYFSFFSLLHIIFSLVVIFIL